MGCEIRASRLNHRDYGLYHVISDVHADWPNSATTEQQSAIKYLSNQTCARDNIRDEYNADQNITTTWKTMLTGLPYAAGNGFNRTTFAQVQKQLGTEFSDVFVVDGLKSGMQTLLSDQQRSPTTRSSRSRSSASSSSCSRSR